MKTYKSTTEERIQKRMAKRLEKIGMKLIKNRRGEGFAILCYSEAVRGWIEADGMFPVPYSLSLEDVIKLTHEYVTEAEIEELEQACP